MDRATVNISNMTCASCAKAVENAVAKINGVSNASVNYVSGKLFAEYDGRSETLQKIKQAIINAGYGIVEHYESISLAIGGMSCAACASRVEKALKSTDGIINASVNLATGNAQVEYDPQEIGLSEIRQAIEKAGYKALSIEKSGVDTENLSTQKEIRTLWAKFIVSAVFGVLLLYLAMGPMVLKLPVPAFVEPMHHPLNYAIAQLVLVIPIIAAGYRFYTVGVKALVRRSPNMDSLIAVGTSAAVVYSLYSTYRIAAGGHHAVEGLYFETAGVVIALILLGKTLETVSKADGACAENRGPRAGRQGNRSAGRRSGTRRHYSRKARRQNSG